MNSVQYYLDKCKALNYWLKMWTDEKLYIQDLIRMVFENNIIVYRGETQSLLPFDEWWELNKLSWLTDLNDIEITINTIKDENHKRRVDKRKEVR